MKENPLTYVCVPGAWHGAWAWNPVAKRLREAGHDAITLTMPGLSAGDDRRGLRLRDAVDHLVHEVRDLTDIVLVAHSWGGVPTTKAAHVLGDRVRKIVFFSALVPEPGRSILDVFRPESAEFVRKAVAESADDSWAPPLPMVEHELMQDQPFEMQRLLWELLVPMPAAYNEDPFDGPAARDLGVPITYVLAEDDRVVGRPDGAPAFTARLGVEPVLVPGSHEALLTHPDEIAKAILAA